MCGLHGERLFEEIDRAQAGGAHGHLDVGLAGDHHHGHGQAQRLQIGEQREAVLAGHDDIGKHHVEAFGFDEIEGARGVIADGGLVAGETEGAGERRERVGVVVDDEELGQSLM